MSTTQDPYAPDADTSAGRVFTVTGQDWDSITEGLAEEGEDHVVVNMGPQHPSTHGVLRLILELEGETVTEARCGSGGRGAGRLGLGHQLYDLRVSGGGIVAPLYSTGMPPSG